MNLSRQSLQTILSRPYLVRSVASPQQIHLYVHVQMHLFLFVSILNGPWLDSMYVVSLHTALRA